MYVLIFILKSKKGYRDTKTILCLWDTVLQDIIEIYEIIVLKFFKDFQLIILVRFQHASKLLNFGNLNKIAWLVFGIES